MSAITVFFKVIAVIFVTLVLLPFQLFGLWRKNRLRLTIPIIWHRLISRILGFKIEIIGLPVAGHPAIYIANHISWSDIVVFGAATPLSFIAKSEIADWPIFGHLAKLQRVVFVERSRPTQSAVQNDTIRMRLLEGAQLVLFAEGTTGNGLTLLPFKSTLVGAAHKAAGDMPNGLVALQPVTIAYTHRAGMKLGRTDMDNVAWVGDQELVPHLMGILKGGPIRVVLHFAEPIWVDGTNDRKTLTRRAEDAVRQHFIQHIRGL